MAPFHPAAAGPLAEFAIFLAIGLAFGAVLEMSGFGDSRKLAAQFYLREMTVLKVMFTAIITAAVLIHLASALQLLDLRRVWVNPTYLWPGIVGGLIMGVGFTVGGFCPGTSLVAAATLKLDGIAFVLGGLFGVGLFGETVGRFDGWWQSSFFGRYTLADWLHVPTGVTVILLVLMALGMFVAAEAAERAFGGRAVRRTHRLSLAGAAVLVSLAALTAVIGQPDAAARWRWQAGQSESALATRAVFIDPVEVVDLRRDLSLAVRIYEVRPEADFNRFHLEGARRLDLPQTEDPAFLREFLGAPDDEIRFLASNDEAAAVEAWKRLKAQGAVNVYLIAGGVNGWLQAFPPHPSLARPPEPAIARGNDRFAWDFRYAVGEKIPSAHPEVARRDPWPPDLTVADGAREGAKAGSTASVEAGGWFDGSVPPGAPAARKVVLQRKVVAKGGCG